MGRPKKSTQTQTETSTSVESTQLNTPDHADPTEKCLTPDCTKKQRCRGLCLICYQTARRFITNHKVTWDELEKMGRSLPARSHTKSMFTVAMKKIEEEKKLQHSS